MNITEEPKPKLKDILEKIDIAAKRMKKAKSQNDKIGYEIALKEYERLTKTYEDTIYQNKKPSKVYLRRM